jgi:hypothetical protein
VVSRLVCFVLGHLWHVRSVYPSAWYGKALVHFVCRRCGKEEVSHG